jgi:hypothetical protein
VGAPRYETPNVNKVWTCHMWQVMKGSICDGCWLDVACLKGGKWRENHRVIFFSQVIILCPVIEVGHTVA